MTESLPQPAVAGGLAGDEGALRRHLQDEDRVAEWSALFEGTDACVAPVLSPWEAHEHPHNVARATFIEVDGAVQPAPAPRFSKTPSAVREPPSPPGADTVSGLVEWGVDENVVAKLRDPGRSAKDAGLREEGPCGAPSSSQPPERRSHAEAHPSTR